MAVFRELRDVNVKFLSSNPEKAHPRCITRKNRFRGLGCRLLHELPQKEAE